jgi:hypothetical protein
MYTGRWGRPSAHLARGDATNRNTVAAGAVVIEKLDVIARIYGQAIVLI